MNMLAIGDTSLEILGHRDADVRDRAQTLPHVDALAEQVRSPRPSWCSSRPTSRKREALDVAFKAAVSEATILLRGESDTGKEVLARAIHARSPAPLIRWSLFTVRVFPPTELHGQIDRGKVMEWRCPVSSGTSFTAR